MSGIECLSRGVLVEEGSVLVCRDLAHGHAYLPGGHIETGEPAHEALGREYQEETGLEIQVGPLALVWEAMFTQQGSSKHEITLVFHVERAPSSEGRPSVVSQEEHIAFEWVPLGDIGRAGIVPVSLARWLADPHDRQGGADWRSIRE